MIENIETLSKGYVLVDGVTKAGIIHEKIIKGKKKFILEPDVSITLGQSPDPMHPGLYFNIEANPDNALATNENAVLDLRNPSNHKGTFVVQKLLGLTYSQNLELRSKRYPENFIKARFFMK